MSELQAEGHIVSGKGLLGVIYYLKLICDLFKGNRVGKLGFVICVFWLLFYTVFVTQSEIWVSPAPPTPCKVGMKHER